MRNVVLCQHLIYILLRGFVFCVFLILLEYESLTEHVVRAFQPSFTNVSLFVETDWMHFFSLWFVNFSQSCYISPTAYSWIYPTLRCSKTMFDNLSGRHCTIWQFYDTFIIVNLTTFCSCSKCHASKLLDCFCNCAYFNQNVFFCEQLFQLPNVASARCGKCQ